jgi:septal ring factor EnvC (AmiA/AmiB activator)
MKKLIFCLTTIILATTTFSNSLDDKKNQINQIENEIKRKGEEIKKNTQKIKTIDKKTETLKEQITRVEKELKIIESEKELLKEKIDVVSRKVDYGKRNLKFSSKELTNMENDYVAMLQSWQKKEITDETDTYNFKEILKANQERQEEIKNVQHNIKKVKEDIEKEQRNLRKLQSQLAYKERQQESKKRQHNNLIAQYNKDKKITTAKTKRAKNTITNLQKQKAAIEKEIDNIIRTRTKQLGNVNYSTVAKNLGSFRKPISGRVVVRFNEAKVGGIRSSGQEIKGSLGDRVIAANKGKVIYAGKFMNMGKVVMIDHGYNLITIYGNLITNYVKLGQTVGKGSKIGVLGLNLDGKSYLYYETRFNLKSSNPSNF